MDNLTREFLAESNEGLDRMEQCLTALEANPGDTGLLADIFRCVHTIKGTTGFLGFGRLEKLAHTGENLLSALREGRLTAEPAVISGLLQLADGLRRIVLLIGETGAEGERTAGEDAELSALLVSLTPEQQSRTTRKHGPSAPPVSSEEILPTSMKQAPGASTPSTNEKTIRIDVEVLNRMMNLVGDLVLTRNQLLQSHVDAEKFPQLARRLDSITADLRETVMQARMQPVGILFSKFPRMVRDLARTCGKNVRIEFSGQDTGLDKSLLEAVKDPLTHAIRNCVDHGIEAPGARLMAGKSSEGLVTLRARHQSGFVVIEVEDDGNGIQIARVIEKAIEQGLITEAAAATISEHDALQFIFSPGFSTAGVITTVSGRGVGMDVVRANIEKVGGSVELETRPGLGTRLRLRVPLTLAIIPALVVQSGLQSFCIPQGSLAELVYVPRREAIQAIEMVGGSHLYRLHDELLPMVWLDELLSLDAEDRQRRDYGFYLAVLEADGCRYGLVIDDLMSPEEIVVKPLSALLREVGLFSGATVLGNGTLALILDVAAMAARARIKATISGAVQHLLQAKKISQEASFLIFQDTLDEAGERKALPLSSVERIERVLVRDIEVVEGVPYLQYRGALLSVEDPSQLLAKLSTNNNAMVTIIIRHGGRSLQGGGFANDPAENTGLVVSRVLDVSGGELLSANRSGVSGRLALVKDKLTVVQNASAIEHLGEVA